MGVSYKEFSEQIFDVIVMGKIGVEVINKCTALGFKNISFFTKNIHKKRDGLKVDVNYKSLDDIFTDSNAVVVCCELTKWTTVKTQVK